MDSGAPNDDDDDDDDDDDELVLQTLMHVAEKIFGFLLFCATFCCLLKYNEETA